MMTNTKKELATLAGYTYRRLYDINNGLPEGEKLFVEASDGKYDTALFVQRWVAYNVNNEHESVGKSLDEIKALHEAVKKRKTELEVMRMEGNMIDASEVKRIWADIANSVMQNMLRVPSKAAPMVTMMESTEKIAAIIDKEIRDALNMIAETPVPSYATEDAEQETEEE